MSCLKYDIILKEKISLEIIIKNMIVVSTAIFLPVVATPGTACANVIILDQYETEVASVESGGIYHIERLTEIIDTIDSNTATIIIPLT